MRVLDLILLIGLATGATALPRFQSPSTSALSKRDDVYNYYSGDGTTNAGWPDQSQWVDFDTMWNNNLQIMTGGCQGYGVDNDSSQELSDVQSAIMSISSESGVDNRFILAIVLEESTGCVRVPTSGNPYRNPGLMQSFEGTGTCNDNGNVQNPCPSDEITQMIKDGTEGTATGNGLQQNLQQAGASDVSQYYKAATLYNAGQIDSSGNLNAPQGANACYACDIANRLTGWITASSDCDFNTGNQT